MIVNGKQYAVVIFKNNRFASCTGCPFNGVDGNDRACCTARSDGFKSCIDEASQRRLKNKFSLTYREVNHE